MEQSKEYDVALSFAGEDRSYVEQVADVLVRAKLKVFYDLYEEVELWGKNLYVHLDDVYRKKATYCVLFVSEAYKNKLWCRHEWASAQARAFAENQEYILPARFDETELPGLRPTTAYIDLSRYSPQRFAELVFRKVGVSKLVAFFPHDLDQLFKTLGIRSKKSCNQIDMAVRYLFSEMGLLTEEERRLVYWLFAAGCPHNLPEDIHIDQVLFERTSNLTADRTKELAKRLGSFGFEIKVTRKHIKAEVIDRRNGNNVTGLFASLVDTVTRDYCREHGEAVFVRLDFSRLSSEFDEQPHCSHTDKHAD